MIESLNSGDTSHSDVAPVGDGDPSHVDDDDSDQEEDHESENLQRSVEEGESVFRRGRIAHRFGKGMFERKSFLRIESKQEKKNFFS